jgi:hypothetical protein
MKVSLLSLITKTFLSMVFIIDNDIYVHCIRRSRRLKKCVINVDYSCVKQSKNSRDDTVDLVSQYIVVIKKKSSLSNK